VVATTSWAPVFAFVGKDRFLRQEALAQLMRALTPDSASATVARFNGLQAEPAEVLDEVRSPSLLGDRRVVVVDDADDFIGRSRAALERYAGSPTVENCLILLCDSLPKNTRLYKIIAETGRVTACEPPKGRAVLTWIGRRAQETYGKRCDGAAAMRLKEAVGDGLAALDAELSKLADYVGTRPEITAADVDAVTGRLRPETIFAVLDAMFSGDAAGALAAWQQVLATDRAAPGRALAGLAWGVRRLLEARKDWERGTNLTELARRMYTEPAVLKKRLERLTTERLMEQQRDLLAADLAVKTGASTFESAVEKFLVRHAAAEVSKGPLS
jgi:DNA polymerase-3 subunit delta